VLSAFAYLKDFAMPPRPGVHRNIVFENNTIDGSANCGIFAAGVDGIRIAGNTIRNACQSPTKPEGSAAVCIVNSSGAAVVNNRIDASRQGPGFRDAVRNIGVHQAVTTQ
jgi:parallel beta-helix repeat protein